MSSARYITGLRAVEQVLASGKLGWHHEPESMTARFERAFAAKVGVRYGIARSSAMTALAQAMGVSGAGVGSEVICDPIVHFGALAAISMNAVPRFADVRRDTYLMDPASVRANITARTKALIVTHLWGLCAELDELRQICEWLRHHTVTETARSLGVSRAGIWRRAVALPQRLVGAGLAATQARRAGWDHGPAGLAGGIALAGW